MADVQRELLFRVRYSEIDSMNTYYNARALEWFEYGRNELIRSLGKPYKQWEEEGVRMPLCEVHARFLGPARYDDELRIISSVAMQGRVRVRFDNKIEQADSGKSVCQGYTIHAVTDVLGKPIRPPFWLAELIELANG